jgi:hypothetical protein
MLLFPELGLFPAPRFGTFDTYRWPLTKSVVEGKADCQLHVRTNQFDPKRTSWR